MRRKMVLGNWKMNGSRSDAIQWTGAAAKMASALPTVDIGVLPAFPYLSDARNAAMHTPLLLGAQDVAAYPGGAYTGEVSASMLADVGATLVLAGHSERRHVLGEDDGVVSSKFAQAQAAGLTPVLCVGETLQQRDDDATADVVLAQVDAVIRRCGLQSLARAVIAYEPVWAIGTGRSASPEQVQMIHALIRSAIAKHDAMLASLIRILYGGSVKGSNAAILFRQPDVDGGLIGGAALVPDEFADICRAANQDG